MRLRWAAGSTTKRSALSWWYGIAACSLVGLVIRVAAVLGRPDRKPLGDAYFYHYAANLLVEGKGFNNPFIYNAHHRLVETASFPPGFVFVLAVAALVGFKSFFAQRIWCAIIGAGAVAVCGMAGREVAGRRAGIIVAAIVAVYPNIWMSNEAAMSETLTPLFVALVLMLGFRFWKQPKTSTALWLGLTIGAMSLARDELTLFAVLLFVPLVLLVKNFSWKSKGKAFGAGVAAAVILVGPWIGYNMSRFQDPVFISTGLGVTLASTNCAQVYNGPYEGYWSISCASAAPDNKQADESVQGAQAEHFALHYVRTHEGRLVPVFAARVGREFGLFHPMQQLNLDAMLEGRPYHWALIGLIMFYCLSVLSLPALVILHRRRVPLFPFAAVTVTVLVAIALSFGDTRYRTPFEVVVVLLASTTLDWAWSSLTARHTARSNSDALRGASTGPATPTPVPAT